MDARLTAYLLTQAEQQITAVATLEEARAYLRERSWAAVVLDTLLADGSGFDLLALLTEMRFEGGVLVLSASRDVGDKVRALEAGADDYVVRPYEPSELLARVKALLRRSRRRLGALQSGETGLVRVGPVELDANALVVSLPGNRRERLTPNEMRLLHYLMTHAGRVVDHQELLARLFGTQQHQTSSNAVGVYMRRVRRKIEDDPDQPHYIVTVRGSGYRFQAIDAPTGVTPRRNRPKTEERHTDADDHGAEKAPEKQAAADSHENERTASYDLGDKVYGVAYSP